jgi:uncharacterized membrane protein YfcA
MALSLTILAKGLLAGVIVGFVTASIQSWVDRFFLVIILIGLVGIRIQDAVVINLVVVSLAALMMLLRQADVLLSVRTHWAEIVVPAAVGGALGRVIALNLKPAVLLAILGVYAILAGLRLVFVRPLAERENKAHPAWMVAIAGGSGVLGGMLSAGGKPFAVPLYNAALGHHPRKAYALATLGVVSSVWVSLLTHVGLGQAIGQTSLLLALYLFVVIALTSLAVARVWTPTLNRIVTYTIAPILVLVGARFLWMVFR